MEFVYYYSPSVYEEVKGGWIKIGRSLDLISESPIFIFEKSDFQWPRSDVVLSTNVILGRNGSGKTTALSRIFSSLPRDGEFIEGSAVIIKENGNYYLFLTREFTHDVEIRGIDLKRFTFDGSSEYIENVLSRALVVSVNTTISYSNPKYTGLLGAIDVTSNGLMASDMRNGRATIGSQSFNSHLSQDLRRDLNFFTSDGFRAVEIASEIKFPTTLDLKLNKLLAATYRSKIRYKEKYINLSDNGSRDNQMLHQQLADRIFSTVDRASRSNNPLEFIEGLNASAFAHCLTESITESDLDPYYNFLKDISTAFNEPTDLTKFASRAPFIRDRWRKIRGPLEQISTIIEQVSTQGERRGLAIDIKQHPHGTETIIHRLQDIFETRSPIDFSWRNLSSGEQAILKLFSRLKQALTEIQLKGERPKTILILLDEPDTCLHPDWERRLLGVLFTYIETIFAEYSVQLVLTTNKPFFLSDLTNKNITVLGKTIDDGQKFSTFCNRIPSILAHDFFLSSDLGEISKKFFNRLKTQGANASEDDKEMIKFVGDIYLQHALETLTKWHLNQ
jgi:predicted ATP-binding protein involved in virulence